MICYRITIDVTGVSNRIIPFFVRKKKYHLKSEETAWLSLSREKRERKRFQDPWNPLWTPMNHQWIDGGWAELAFRESARQLHTSPKTFPPNNSAPAAAAEKTSTRLHSPTRVLKLTSPVVGGVLWHCARGNKKAVFTVVVITSLLLLLLLLPA